MQNDLQRIDLKALLDVAEGTKYEPILTVFDRWRQETDAPSDWVDLADYAHMRQGPAVIMAGKREHLAIDTNEPGPGVLVQTRKDLSGDVSERFLEAFRRHLALSTRLTSEPEWPSGIQVRGGDWVVAVNDRLGFPNSEETDEQLRAGMTAALDRLFGEGGYDLTREENAESRYGYRVRAEGNPTLKELQEKAA